MSYKLLGEAPGGRCLRRPVHHPAIADTVISQQSGYLEQRTQSFFLEVPIMKRIISFILVVTILLGMVPATVFATEGDNGAAHPFTDVRSRDWYSDYVTYVWQNGIFYGTSATTFAPKDPLTRAMFVTVLGRLAEVDADAYTEAVFTDVDPDTWYGPYVAWASEQGITNGVGNDMFDPHSYATRQQIATFLLNFLHLTGEEVEGKPLSYRDADKIADYAKEAVEVCLALGLMEGDTNKCFRPEDPATRGEAAKVCAKLHQYLQEQGSITRYYKVTFGTPANADYAPEEMEDSVLVEADSQVYELPLPKRNNYVFCGWFSDADLTQLVPNDAIVTADMTLYPMMVPCDDIEEEQWPSYALNYIASQDVAPDFTLQVQAKSAEQVRNSLSFKSFSDQDGEIDYDIMDEGNGIFTLKPVGGLMAGGSYQVAAIDRDQPPTFDDEGNLVEADVVLFISGGEVMDPEIQYHNIVVAIEEHNDMRIDKSVIFLPFDQVSDIVLADVLLYDMREDGMQVNDKTDTFTYHGDALCVGDVVAIYDGVLNEENGDVDGEVAYVKITEINGSIYSYALPGIQEILFTAQALPVPMDDPETEEVDGAFFNEDGTVTVYNEYLDFSVFAQYPELDMDGETVAEVGDYLALYTGIIDDSTSYGYYEIMGIRHDQNSEITVFTVVERDEVKSASLYDVYTDDLGITAQAIAELEAEAKKQAIESGFADQAAKYLVDALLSGEELKEVLNGYSLDDVVIISPQGDDAWYEGGEWNPEIGEDTSLTIEAGAIEAGVGTLMVEVGKVDVHVKGSLDLEEITAMTKGVRLELGLTFTVQIGNYVVGTGWADCVSLQVSASFVQEVAFTPRAGFQEIKGTILGIPYTKEYQVMAGVDIGTYVGIGATFTVVAAEDFDSSFPWEEAIRELDPNYDPGFPNVDSIARQIRKMMTDETTFALGNGEESLITIYQDLLEKEIDYVEILAIRCPGTPIKIALPYKIGQLTIDLELVISAKMSVTVGLAMETLSVRRYEFNAWINIVDFKAGYNTNSMDLQTPYTELNLYLMGNIGLRVGPRIGVSVSLLTVGAKKHALATAGISVYFGYTVDMYGIFFSHLRVEDGKITEGSRCIGALEANHGIFLDLDFHLGVLMDILAVDIHVLDITWNILDKKGEPRVFEATKRTHTAQMWNNTPYKIGNDLLKMNTLVVKTGALGKKNLNHKNFQVALSNPYFHYNAADGSITVDAPENSILETCEVRMTYTGGDTLFSVTPITVTIDLTWEKTWPSHFVRFCSSYYHSDEYGYVAYAWDTPVQEYRFIEGEIITGIEVPVMERAGYDFLGWYYMDDSLEGVENGTLLSDLNDLEGYAMPNSDINIAPVFEARNDTPYTLNYYIETVAGTGAYELYQTTVHAGTTDSYLPAATIVMHASADLGVMDGFALNYAKLPTDDSGRIFGYVPVEGDGSGSGDIFMERESYSVFYHVNNRDYTGVGTTQVRGTYGSELTGAPDLDSANVPGWSFTGWTDSEGNPVELPETIPTDTGKGAIYVGSQYFPYGTHFFGSWEPSFNYYTVNYHIKNAEGVYELVETLVGSDSNPAIGGYTGDYISAEPFIKAFDGATLSRYTCTTADGVETFRIEGVPGTGAGDKQHNGQVLDLYYNRDYYRVFWNGAEGEILQYYYNGQTITAPEGLTAEAKDGYQVDGWKNTVAEGEIYREGNEMKMGNHYKNFVPNYIPASDTPYTVIHKRPAAGTYNDYSDETLWETVVGYGTTDTLMTAEVKEYDGFVTPEAKEFLIRADGSATVTYQYARQSYSVTLDFAGGEELSYARNYYYDLPFNIPMNVTREGYKFLGWQLANEGISASYYDGEVLGSCLTSMQDLVFVAQWEAIPISYTVEHYLQELDGSYGAPRTITLTSFMGELVTAQPSDFVGFRFDADNAMNVTSGTIATAQGGLVDDEGNPVSLRLYYSRNSYTVTWYDYDGSVLGTADVIYGAEITLPETVGQPERMGYTFGGWKVFGSMGTADVQFHAAEDGTWNANTYTVRFDANGGTGEMADQSFIYDAEQVLNSNTFTYVNRNFVGWSAAPDGETLYINNQSVRNLTAENGGVVTLYAQWELMEGATAQYTVEHYLEALEGGYEKYTETTGYGLIEQERTLSAADAITVEGFSFDPDGDNVLTAIVMEDGSTVFKLCYIRNRYELTLDYGDEQMKVVIRDEENHKQIVTRDQDPERARENAVLSIRYGEDLSAYLTDLEVETGYIFAGWDNDMVTMPAGNVHVTAQWEPVEVTVTFHPGTYWFYPGDLDLYDYAVTMTFRYGDEVMAPEGIVEQFVALQSRTMTEVGWIFGIDQANYPTMPHFPMIIVDGYYYDDFTFRAQAEDEDGYYIYDEDGNPVYSDSYAVTVSPFWASRYDEVFFDANGGEGIMPSMKVYSDGSRDLPRCTFTREGYVLVGWNTASDGSGTDYGVYDSVGYLGGGTELTLYAQWEKLP